MARPSRSFCRKKNKTSLAGMPLRGWFAVCLHESQSVFLCSVISHRRYFTRSKERISLKKALAKQVLFSGGSGWNYHPRFAAFHEFSTPLKKQHNHALFRVSRVCTRNRKNTNFQKIRVRFVYGFMGRDTPAHRFILIPHRFAHAERAVQRAAYLLRRVRSGGVDRLLHLPCLGKRDRVARSVLV